MFHGQRPDMNRFLVKALGQGRGVGAPPATVERFRDDFDHHHVVGFGVAIGRRPQAFGW